MRHFLTHPFQSRMFQRFALATLLTAGSLTWYQQHQTPVLLTTRAVEVNPLQLLPDHSSSDPLSEPSNPATAPSVPIESTESTESTQSPEIFQQIEAALRVKL